MARSVTSNALINQRNALVALAKHLQHPGGGMLTSSLEMLAKATRAVGAFAYRAFDKELSLVADLGVPREAKPWISTLTISDEDWFVAQRVARTRKALIDRSIAGEMHSIGPAFEQAGWRVLAVAPIIAGRQVLGVIGLAGNNRHQFDDDMLRFLAAAGGMLGVALDHAEMAERTRDERHEAKKRAELATLGLIAANAARDLARPLTALQEVNDQQMNWLAKLRSHLEGVAASEVTELLNNLDDGFDELAEELRLAQGINSRQLSLSRESSAEPLNLVAVAHSAAQMASSTFDAAGIGLTVDTDHAELWVDGRHESLSLMLVQLLLQAAHRSDAGPTSGPTVVLQLLSDEARHFVTIDTTGNPDQRTQHNLYQTLTKRQDRSGDMVAIKQTVLAHKGHIEFGRSEMGGVRFSVVLPHSQSAASPVSSGVQATPVPSAMGHDLELAQDTIVIIDDNDALVRVVRRQLRGYQLHSAGCVEESVKLLKSLSPPPRLVICDINLPDGTGIDIHRAVDFQLGSRFVFVTSGLLDRDVSAYIQASNCPVFSKPLAVDEMRALLVADDLANHPSLMPTLSPAPTPPPFHHTEEALRLIRRRMARTNREAPTSKKNPKAINGD